jgi:hypothetical protein
MSRPIALNTFMYVWFMVFIRYRSASTYFVLEVSIAIGVYHCSSPSMGQSYRLWRLKSIRLAFASYTLGVRLITRM